MTQDGGMGTPRQRAVEAAREMKKEAEMEEARRQKEIMETNKKKWHAGRTKGTIRQREESPATEVGGPSKLQGTGSPTRGTGVKKSPGLP